MSESIYDAEIKLIRKALKALAPTLSIRRGRGMAYSWIEVKGSGRWGEFTEDEKGALETFGLRYGSNHAVISPEDRRFYVEKAAKLLGVELPSPIREDYRERDEYRKELERKAEERRKCQHDWVKRPEIVVVVPRNHELYRCEKCGLEKVEPR